MFFSKLSVIAWPIPGLIFTVSSPMPIPRSPSFPFRAGVAWIVCCLPSLRIVSVIGCSGCLAIASFRW